jgi:broad specificity phosphatase PhoE
MEHVLVRHGEPQWDIDGRGVDDPVLTAIGHEQAALLGERFRDLEFDRVLVSPLIRARQTAEPIIDALGVEPEIIDWLPEISAPVWEGTPSEVIERAFAEGRDRPVEQQWDGLPGGESFRDFHNRVTIGIDGLLADLGCTRLNGFPPLWHLDDPGPRVLIVAHSGTNAVALGHLLGIEPVPWEWERFVAFHASVSIVRPMRIASAHSFSLFRFSDIGHLPEHLHTR